MADQPAGLLVLGCGEDFKHRGAWLSEDEIAERGAVRASDELAIREERGLLVNGKV